MERGNGNVSDAWPRRFFLVNRKERDRKGASVSTVEIRIDFGSSDPGAAEKGRSDEKRRVADGKIHLNSSGVFSLFRFQFEGGGACGGKSVVKFERTDSRLV